MKGSFFKIAVHIAQNPFHAVILGHPRFEHPECIGAVDETSVNFGEIGFLRFSLGTQSAHFFVVAHGKVERFRASHHQQAVGVFRHCCGIGGCGVSRVKVGKCGQVQWHFHGRHSRRV